MIIKASDYLTMSDDVDLSQIENLSFYCKKISTIADSNPNKDRMKDAKKILGVLKEYCPHNFL